MNRRPCSHAGCWRRPHFAPPGTKTPLYCGQHKRAGNVNVLQACGHQGARAAPPRPRPHAWKLLRAARLAPRALYRRSRCARCLYRAADPRRARAGCSKTASYGHWGSNPRMFCYEHRCAPAATRPHDGERPAAVGRACRARTGPARSPCYLRGYSAPHARRGCRPGSAGAPTGPQHGAPAGRSQAAPPSGQRARAGRRTWSARPCRPRRGVSRAARARRAAQSARPRVRARPASAPACRAAGWGSLHAQAPAVVESDAAGRSRSLRMCRQLSSARGMRGVSPSELCALLAACWELLLLGACAWRPTSPRQGRC